MRFLALLFLGGGGEGRKGFPPPQAFQKKMRLKLAVKFFTADFSLKRFFKVRNFLRYLFPWGIKTIFFENFPENLISF